MKKKFVALLTVMVLCLGCLVISAFAETTYVYSNGVLVGAIVTNSDGSTTTYYYDADGNVSYYTDVAYSSWYYEAVNDVTEKGFMTGMGDGKFEPDTPLSRAMFITVLYRMSTDYGNYVDADSGFSDVENGTWYSDAVAWAADKQITSGTSATTFSPDIAVTREQMATFVANYLDAYHITLTASDNTVSAFKDSEEVSSWAVSALELMRTTGIIKGDDAGNFRPKDTATRAEAATIFYRLIQSAETYPGYDYTIYLVGTSEIYSGYAYCFFIETENPDATSFEITIDSGSYVSSTGYWDDVESTETDSNLNQVDGGYILTLKSSSKKYDQTEGWISCNLSEIDIYEIGSCNSEKQVKSVTVDTIDYTEAQTAWINSLIEDYTSNDMTPFEKMDAICSYLKSSESGFTYLPNDGTYLLTLTTNSGPYFVRKTWDSYTSPAVLCLIAEAIGEFDYIHNCYYDYASGTDEWKSTHYYCKVGIGDDIRSYQVCPLTGTGYVDTITYVDFTATESMTLLG